MRKMRKEYAHQTTIVLALQCGEIDQKLKILYGRMVIEVINVLCCFLGYAKTFSQEKVHMMLALMLDPCFKGMDYIMDHIS
jgi:hypothetical protein